MSIEHQPTVGELWIVDGVRDPVRAEKVYLNGRVRLEGIRHQWRIGVPARLPTRSVPQLVACGEHTGRAVLATDETLAARVRAIAKCDALKKAREAADAEYEYLRTRMKTIQAKMRQGN